MTVIVEGIFYTTYFITQKISQCWLSANCFVLGLFWGKILLTVLVLCVDLSFNKLYKPFLALKKQCLAPC